MGIFSNKKDKKKSGGLPELPELPPQRVSPMQTGDLPEFDDDEDNDEGQETHVLPAFPDSPTHNRFSQVAIKAAVSDNKEDIFNELPKESKNIKVVEMEEWHHPKHEVDHFEEPDYSGGHGAVHEPEEAPEPEHGIVSFPDPSRRVSKDKGGSDVFVKLEKFRSARKSLDEISDKLEEIDLMIKKIREVKLREDQELSRWEKDITHVKARISDVNENIFEKVE